VVPHNYKNSEFPESLKLALTYATDSAARARRIVFFIQMAAVLVLAALWQEADHNWAQLRLNAAQAAVKFLSCEPQTAYSLPAAPSTVLPAEAEARAAMNRELAKGIPPTTREEKEYAYDCLARPLTDHERALALGYLQHRRHSLADAKQNVSALRLIANDRVTVPVLGISFDINDLSMISGIAFCILLSWFYFAVRRQQQDVSRVFEIARGCKVADDGSPGEIAKNGIEDAYDLLKMTQVLAVPPTQSKDISWLRRLTRLPNLILWTPALAELAVLINDMQTLSAADYLSPLVNRAETALAVYLFGYILYKTVRCFGLLGEINREWVRAWNEFNPESRQITAPSASKFSRWLKAPHRTITIVSIVLGLAVIFHLIDEGHLGFLTSWQKMFGTVLAKGWTSVVGLLLDHGQWLNIIVLLLVAVVFLLVIYQRKLRITLGLAWILSGFALLDVMVHNLRAIYEAQSSEFTQHMEGFYSSPLLLILALVLVYKIRHDYMDGATTPGAAAPAAPAGTPKAGGVAAGKADG
jgi:hypothetical protein